VGQQWVIALGGIKEIGSLPPRDIEVGWARWLERIDKPEERKRITVLVKSGRRNMPGLPAECQQAIETQGVSAIRAVLDRDVPPRYITVTEDGLVEEDSDDE
jgi:hypothetical protein